MPTCPICIKPLETVRQREGVFYPCRICDGRALTIPQVRHMLGDRVATKLLRLLKLGQPATGHSCPFCNNPMSLITAEEPHLELESCRSCSIVWFDLPTYESLPQLATETSNTIAMQSTEIIALTRLKELKERSAEQEKQQKKKKRFGRFLNRDE